MWGKKETFSLRTSLIISLISIAILSIAYVVINYDDLFGHSKQELQEIISTQQATIKELKESNDKLVLALKEQHEKSLNDIKELTDFYTKSLEREKENLEKEKSRLDKINKTVKKQIVYVKDKINVLETTGLTKTELDAISVIQIDHLWKMYEENK